MNKYTREFKYVEDGKVISSTEEMIELAPHQAINASMADRVTVRAGYIWKK